MLGLMVCVGFLGVSSRCGFGATIGPAILALWREVMRPLLELLRLLEISGLAACGLFVTERCLATEGADDRGAWRRTDGLEGLVLRGTLRLTAGDCRLGAALLGTDLRGDGLAADILLRPAPLERLGAAARGAELRLPAPRDTLGLLTLGAGLLPLPARSCGEGFGAARTCWGAEPLLAPFAPPPREFFAQTTGHNTINRSSDAVSKDLFLVLLFGANMTRLLSLQMPPDFDMPTGHSQPAGSTCASSSLTYPSESPSQ